MASLVSDYTEAHTDYNNMEIDERILQDSQYNMVEFAKKYFREAHRKTRSVFSFNFGTCVNVDRRNGIVDSHGL